jgi:hypothetical protein
MLASEYCVGLTNEKHHFQSYFIVSWLNHSSSDTQQACQTLTEDKHATFASGPRSYDDINS